MQLSLLFACHVLRRASQQIRGLCQALVASNPNPYLREKCSTPSPDNYSFIGHLGPWLDHANIGGDHCVALRGNSWRFFLCIHFGGY